MSTKTKTPKLEKQPKEPKAPKAPKGAKEPKPGKNSKQIRAAEINEPAAVNLLSPWVLEELRVLRLRKRFLLGTLALVLVLGLCWMGLRLQLHRSEQEVRGEETVTTGLSDQIETLSEVRSYVTDVETRSRMVANVTGDEARFSLALAALADALPRSATLSSLTVKLPVAAVAGEEGEAVCPGPDPFGGATKDLVACMEISGTADSRDDVSDFVQRLDQVPLFLEPFVATTTRDTDQEVTWTGTVGITARALKDAAAGDTEGGTR